MQSTEWSLYPQVFKQICQNKLLLYVSPVPDPKAWDIDALNINWTGLTAYAYPPMALLHRVIQKIRKCYCLIIVIAPGWPGMSWFWDLVQLSTEIPLQLYKCQQLFSNSPTIMCSTAIHSISTSTSRSGQLQEQGFSVEVAERIAAPQRSSTMTIYKSKWALFEKWCRENSVKHISDFFSSTCTKI